MFGYTVGDWLFIILVFIVIVICVGASDLYGKRK